MLNVPLIQGQGYSDYNTLDDWGLETRSFKHIMKPNIPDLYNKGSLNAKFMVAVLITIITLIVYDVWRRMRYNDYKLEDNLARLKCIVKAINKVNS